MVLGVESTDEIVMRLFQGCVRHWTRDRDAARRLAVAAGLETLTRLRQPGSYERLSAVSTRLAEGMQELAAAAGVEFTATSCGG